MSRLISSARNLPATIIGSIAVLILASVSVAMVGCDASVERFDPNLLYALSLEKTRDVPTETATDHAAEVVAELFGTPESPRWPVEWMDDDAGSILKDPEHLNQAIGKISSDQNDQHRGLYREHCVICHGVSGSGNGPASLFQDPYPRDFRHGVFKWKSTKRGDKPTRGDLLGLLRRGIPGTSMPSYAILSNEQRDVLVDYLIYLAVRGEVERELMTVAVDELGYEETPADSEVDLSLVFAGVDGRDIEAAEVIRDIVGDVVDSWREAESDIVEVPPVPRESLRVTTGDVKTIGWTDEAIERGRQIYEGQVANCVGCHGKHGLADVATLDYDDWTKEYTTRIGITPSDREAVEPLRKLGALPPRPVRPRRLADGVFHGAGTTEAIYRQITQGIAGSPMPAVTLTDEPSPTGLTPDQVFDLVAYVQSLADGD